MTVFATGWDPQGDAGRDAIVAFLRGLLAKGGRDFAEVGEWLRAEYSAPTVLARYRERRRTNAETLANQPLTEGVRLPTTVPSKRPEPHGNSLRAFQLDCAIHDLVALNKAVGSARLLGPNQPQKERILRARRSLVVSLSVIDPDADQWLAKPAEAARCPWRIDGDRSMDGKRFAVFEGWRRGRSGVFDQWGREALTLAREAAQLLGWNRPAADVKREREARRAAERVRAVRSPEYLWNAMFWQSQRLTVPPNGTTAHPSKEPPRDDLNDVGPLMKHRVAIVAAPDFTPSRYPGIRPNALKAGGEGWIAWSILPELRALLSFAGWSKDARRESIRAAFARTVGQAKAFIQGRVKDSALDSDDRARCDALIPGVLEGRGAGSPEYAAQSPAEHERERVNELLEIESPWIMPAKPLSHGGQIIDQLRARGHTPDRILRELAQTPFAADPDVAELRRQVAAQGGADQPPADAFGPAHFDPATIRKGFHDCAHLIGMIRAAWIKGDQEQLALLKSGVGPETGGYEETMRHEVRAGVDNLLRRLRTELIPFILPRCDPSLRDRVQRLLRLLDLESLTPDGADGETTRWRQTWPGTGLDADLEEVIPMLRARGDAVVLESASVGEPSHPTDESRRTGTPSSFVGAVAQARDPSALLGYIDGATRLNVNPQNVRQFLRPGISDQLPKNVGGMADAVLAGAMRRAALNSMRTELYRQAAVLRAQDPRLPSLPALGQDAEADIQIHLRQWCAEAVRVSQGVAPAPTGDGQEHHGGSSGALVGSQLERNPPTSGSAGAQAGSPRLSSQDGPPAPVVVTPGLHHIGNAKLAKRLDIKEANHMANQLRKALSKAGQAVPPSKRGKPLIWTRGQLERAIPHLPQGTLRTALEESGLLGHP